MVLIEEISKATTYKILLFFLKRRVTFLNFSLVTIVKKMNLFMIFSLNVQDSLLLLWGNLLSSLHQYNKWGYL